MDLGYLLFPILNVLAGGHEALLLSRLLLSLGKC